MSVFCIKSLEKKEIQDKIEQYRENLELFAKECLHIHHPVKGKIPFIFNFHQQFFDKSLNKHQKGNYLLGMRQVGKTNFLVAFTLHQMLFNPRKAIGFMGTSFTCGKFFLEKLKWQYNQLPEHIKNLAKVEVSTTKKMNLSNGSSITILALTVDAFRGFNFDAVIFDEAEYIENFEKHFEMAKLSTYSCGRIIIISTPKSAEKYTEYFLTKN